MSITNIANNLVSIGTNIVVICAIATALYNASTRRLQGKINGYRLQILALALLAVIKAIQQADLWFLGVALILIIQFIIIERLVAGVTNVEPRQPGQSFRSFLHERLDILKARSIWLENSPENRPNANIVRTNPLTPLSVSGVLVIAAYFVASQVVPRVENFNGLVASLALLLVGLFIMINSYDTLAQMMGLLVMENGLFLAAVIVINDSNLLLAFLVSMFAWYLLTLIILVMFLPRLRQSSHSIYIEDQKTLKE